MLRSETTRVLVLGKGGREHALAWAIGRELGDQRVFLHPGNAGTRRTFADLGSAPWDNAEALAAAIAKNNIKLVVIGPEAPLAAGLSDQLRALGIRVFGPSARAAQLETSKVFAKEFMQRANIPTAPFSVVDTAGQLLEHAAHFPCVLKLDGLAAGKGVVIAQSADDVREFADAVWDRGIFGKGPHRIVVEGFLSGDELSYIGLCDGRTFVPLSTSTDYKRIGDGATGPNTGGMGAISPSPFTNPELESKIHERIVRPLLTQLQNEDFDYRGALYIGIMISPSGDPYVLEFNARFGDPETQALMLRINGGFTAALAATSDQRLAPNCLQWREDASVYVVGSAHGYPGEVRTGDPISGLEAKATEDTQIFFSGVEERDGTLVTAGGRVLGIGARRATLEEARAAAYAAWERIHWNGRHLRTDIGLR